MKIYGIGKFVMPGTKRVIHDFANGPFATYNPQIIQAAMKLGYSIGKPMPNPEPVAAPIADEKPAPKKRGRKPKNELS
jgi:hypothetical protein